MGLAYQVFLDWSYQLLPLLCPPWNASCRPYWIACSSHLPHWASVLTGLLPELVLLPDTSVPQDSTEICHLLQGSPQPFLAGLTLLSPFYHNHPIHSYRDCVLPFLFSCVFLTHSSRRGCALFRTGTLSPPRHNAQDWTVYSLADRRCPVNMLKERNTEEQHRIPPHLTPRQKATSSFHFPMSKLKSRVFLPRPF